MGLTQTGNDPLDRDTDASTPVIPPLQVSLMHKYSLYSTFRRSHESGPQVQDCFANM